MTKTETERPAARTAQIVATALAFVALLAIACLLFRPAPGPDDRPTYHASDDSGGPVASSPDENTPRVIPASHGTPKPPAPDPRRAEVGTHDGTQVGLTPGVRKRLARHGEDASVFVEYERQRAETTRTVLALTSHRIHERLRKHRFSVERLVDAEIRPRHRMDDATRDRAVSILKHACDDMVAWRRETRHDKIVALSAELSYAEKIDRDKAVRELWLETERRYGARLRAASAQLGELLESARASDPVHTVPPPGGGSD